jgi:hypothetical protein
VNFSFSHTQVASLVVDAPCTSAPAAYWQAWFAGREHELLAAGVALGQLVVHFQVPSASQLQLRSV